MNAADELLESAKVIVVAGLGGVGKTTLSAALGARAAAIHQRRVMVVTIDPARRLADALGTSSAADEPVLVPVGGDGRLWAYTIDMALSWDRLVAACAPSSDVAEQLVANKLYGSLTRKFVRSHDYIALDYLADAASEAKYDLIIVDTPPSVHVLDILDAPSQIMDLFESRLLKWLTASNQSVVAAQLSRPFLTIAERALGDSFLSDVSEFFFLFSQLRSSFVERTEAVQARLVAPGTRFVTVSTPETAASASVATLSDALAERGFYPALALRNKAWPDLSAVSWDETEQVNDEGLRHALIELRPSPVDNTSASKRTATFDVPYRPEGLSSVEELYTLLD